MKGISRRVIVVDSPDTELFEQAIFIVRNDALQRSGVTSQQIVSEACRVARSYGYTHGGRRRTRVKTSPLFWGALGAGSIAISWLLSTII